MENNLNNKVYQGPNSRDFYQDLLDLFVLKETAMSAHMYSLAWEHGHAFGHREVYHHFQDLVRVFRSE